jgi:hypothetical protein
VFTAVKLMECGLGWNRSQESFRHRPRETGISKYLAAKATKLLTSECALLRGTRILASVKKYSYPILLFLWSNNSLIGKSCSAWRCVLQCLGVCLAVPGGVSCSSCREPASDTFV